MAELADAPDLGSGTSVCRFDPCCPHQTGNPAFRQKRLEYWVFRIFTRYFQYPKTLKTAEKTAKFCIMQHEMQHKSIKPYAKNRFYMGGNP